MSKLYLRTWGQGKPIILVHGWAMHSGVWCGFAEQLALHYRVTCVDLPGHGQSGPLDEFTLEAISTALVNTVDPESSCWLGWSLGATFVLDVAARFPERVNSLVLLAGNPRFVQGEAVSSAVWPGMPSVDFDLFSQNLAINFKSTLLRFLSLQVQGDINDKSLLQQLRMVVNNHENICQNNLQSALMLLRSADMRPVLAELAMPIAVILGGQDALVPVSIGNQIENYPNVKVHVVDNAGHALFLSHQQAVFQLVSHFMDAG